MLEMLERAMKKSPCDVNAATRWMAAALRNAQSRHNQIFDEREIMAERFHDLAMKYYMPEGDRNLSAKSLIFFAIVI